MHFVSPSAIGCPNPTPQTNAWVRRQDEDTLMAKCNDTEETWYLTCHNTEWIGVIGNCTDRKYMQYYIGYDYNEMFAMIC